MEGILPSNLQRKKQLELAGPVGAAYLREFSNMPVSIQTGGGKCGLSRTASRRWQGTARLSMCIAYSMNQFMFPSIPFHC
jgi:hypothetical protein